MAQKTKAQYHLCTSRTLFSRISAGIEKIMLISHLQTKILTLFTIFFQCFLVTHKDRQLGRKAFHVPVRYIVLWAKLVFWSCCSKRGINQIPWDWLCYARVWSPDGWYSSWVEHFMDDYTLHKQTYSTEDIDKSCALILPEHSHSLAFHFRSLFLNTLNRNLFLIALECFPLTWVTKKINEKTNPKTNSSPLLGCCRAPVQLALAPPAARTAPTWLSFGSDWLVFTCMAAKHQGKNFHSSAFPLGPFFLSVDTVFGLLAVCMTNTPPRFLHLGRCCNGIFMSYLARSSASGTESERMKKLPESLDE